MFISLLISAMQRLCFNETNVQFHNTPVDSPFLPPIMTSNGQIVLKKKSAKIPRRYMLVNGRMQLMQDDARPQEQHADDVYCTHQSKPTCKSGRHHNARVADNDSC